MASLEGWSWLHNARKWHYFRGGRSLCRKWSRFGDPPEGYDHAENLNSPDNCIECTRRRKRELAKAEETANAHQG